MQLRYEIGTSKQTSCEKVFRIADEEFCEGCVFGKQHVQVFGRRQKYAMHEELVSLNENNTWSFVDLPSGEKLIGNRWVLRVKTKSDGSSGQFKARPVAKKKYGID
ncbi:hypothetical protein ILUMI_26011 [Ignelater luminosus]|uniref:Reverse transcriptase n=1 Tax=Ignelater luminosus TaxID=2038154 RepID=A0A8K0C4Q3_IGNLU|nr:hypothetical protein ILUMI_26011 [Ignelater luminosus]